MSTVVRSWCRAKSSPRRDASASGRSTTSTQCASWKMIVEHEPDAPRADGVEDDHPPPRVEHEWDDHRPTHMSQLAEEDAQHVAETHRLTQRLLADPLTDERCHVADQQVLDREEPIQRPDVHVLPSEPAMPPLGWRQPRPRRQLEIGIEADDVGVAVVQDVVLDPPQPGAGPERVGRVGEGRVDPPVTRERAVIGVVHDARPHAINANASTAAAADRITSANCEMTSA